MIYRAKCLGIATLKYLLASCAHYHLDEYSTKFQILKMKLSRIDITKYLVDFEKMAGFYRPFCLFISKSIHFLANPSLNVSSILLFNDLVMVTNEGVYCLQTFQKKKHMGIFPLLSHILFHIWNISNIACNKKPWKLKFSLLTNSNLIEFTEKYLEKLLIWNSYKWTTVGAQNSNRNAVFSWKM